MKNARVGHPHPSTRTRADYLGHPSEIHPRLARYLGPPCHLRHGIAYPVCTEGSHFCGVRVWDTFPNVERKL